jgi:pilus assembly protein CpaF
MSFNKAGWRNTATESEIQSLPTEQDVAPAAQSGSFNPRWSAPVTPAATNTDAATSSSRLNQASSNGRVLEVASPASLQNNPALEQFKSRIHQRLIEEIDFNQFNKGGLSPDDDRVKLQVRNAIAQLVKEEWAQAPPEVQLLGDGVLVIDDILNETMGLGPLEYLLKDDSITEIMVNGPHCVFIERGGRLVECNVKFKNDEHLLQIIDRIVSAVGRRVDETQPLCDARLKDGSRFNCVIPPLALDGSLVTIRKFSKKKLEVADLIQYGSLTKEAGDLLSAFVEGHLNIVISGGTGSGKTTLLNVLSSFIPDGDRIVTIEDTAELQLQQRHVARMETRPPNIEGRGEVTMRDLVKNALRMRPERIVVGECRGGEALDMLQAMNTGHDGSMTTLHANTPRDAIRRMETMVMMAGYDLPQRAIREQIASAVHVLIQASRLSDGSRRVMNITEIVGMEGEVILMQDIFKFQQRGLDENGKVIGELKYTGVRPQFLDVLLARGIAIDLNLFEVK